MAPAPIDLQTARAMLAHVADNQNRETWIAVGMALKSEFGDAAYDDWEDWSSTASNFDAKACRVSWRGFRALSQGASVSLGTLVKLAKDGGFKFDGRGQVDQAEVARLRAQRQAQAQRETAQRARDVLSARERAIADWRAASREGDSAYVQRKGIERPESVRFGADGAVLVPMIRYDEPAEMALKGVQRILPDGQKRFTKGMAKSGVACRLGLPVVGEPLFFCEGWATGMSVRMAMERLTGARRWPVYVAFDAWNLPAAVYAVHQALPTCPLVLLGDDDWKTTDKTTGRLRNVGRLQALAAQQGVMDLGARLVVVGTPFFGSLDGRQDGDTDYNDLHRLAGLDEVAAQLKVALDAIEELKRYA